MAYNQPGSPHIKQLPQLSPQSRPQSRSKFLTRASTDIASQLSRQTSYFSSRTPRNEAAEPSIVNERHKSDIYNTLSRAPSHEPTNPNQHYRDGNGRSNMSSQGPTGRRRKSIHSQHGNLYTNAQRQQAGPNGGLASRSSASTGKLGTFSGVFVPTTLNVISILMFLRFGFILGQSGVLGMMGMLIVSYIINLVTTLSISAIATNGTVRGGGAYYLISRSLGPEFGGSIGVVFYLGFVFNTGLNAVGLVDCVKANFGASSGNWVQWLPEGPWIEYAWATVILLICTAICLAGSGIFARCSNGLLAILLLSAVSIPLTALVMRPSHNRGAGIDYTGLSATTFSGNLLPNFTAGAAGSQITGMENFQDLFGILFSATGGIFAGASMSGDLKHPSKAIPKGTLYGLALTFVTYTVIILALAATVTRESFYDNANVIQDINISGVLILLGEFATSAFSSLMGVIGSAKLLQALARDNLVPGFGVFGQGTKGNDEPTYAIIITYVVAQLTILSDINRIASFVTMTYLMTFLVTNLACFLLTISAAPNFRPSFHYFNLWTAGFGALVSGASMFFVDGLSATGSVTILVVLFLLIHYTTPPKPWGDVSQSLIYHQVRKYLLRLRPEHVKFWRPQILLFVNNPRHQYELIQFCNSLKKGALFLLGHVIVSDDFGGAVPEARRQQAAWTKFIDVSKIKAFVNLAISPAVEWGTRNIVLSAGLGGMRPNIVIMGAYNLREFRDAQPLIDVSSTQAVDTKSVQEPRQQPVQNGLNQRDEKLEGETVRALLPTDECRSEGAVSVQSYVTILEDLLLRLQINVAIARGFKNLEFPRLDVKSSKKYIDLWPIQMAAELTAEGAQQHSILTTNFDTYTLILQLGCILNTVPAWKEAFALRVAVFVEYESDVEEERVRVRALLYNLRIPAEVHVFWLASGDLKTYQIIINGSTGPAGDVAKKHVDDVLQDEEWWRNVQELRGRGSKLSAVEELSEVQNLLSGVPNWPNASFQHGRRVSPVRRFEGLKKLIRKSKKNRSTSRLRGLGVKLGMRTHHLQDDVINSHATQSSRSETSSSGDSNSDGESADSDESTSGRASAASENDMDDFEDLAELPVNLSDSPTSRATRRHSDGEAMRGVSRPQETFSKAMNSKLPGVGDNQSTPRETDSKHPISNLTARLSREPLPSRQPSAIRFTSRPVPKTKVASDDGPGPSIMFSDGSSPARENPPPPSIYTHGGPSASSPPAAAAAAATGFPFPQNMPLSFNDLPCRAQHLILNELMLQQSGETAVVFTTLPSPMEGTCKREEDCVTYLSDLEVLCADLPPVLLVHSNSVTVTMSL